MIINDQLLDDITSKAEASPRLRMNYNLHDSLDAKAQRLINVLLPVHRCPFTAIATQQKPMSYCEARCLWCSTTTWALKPNAICSILPKATTAFKFPPANGTASKSSNHLPSSKSKTAHTLPLEPEGICSTKTKRVNKPHSIEYNK